jgi:hypothetical protein
MDGDQKLATSHEQAWNSLGVFCGVVFCFTIDLLDGAAYRPLAGVAVHVHSHVYGDALHKEKKQARCEGMSRGGSCAKWHV